MDSLEQEYIKNKKVYREIFIKAQKSISQQLSAIKKSFYCNNCKDSCEFKHKTNSPIIEFPENCTYINWQKECLKKFKNEISKDVYEKIQELLAYRDTFSCNRCALCCKFASSEFSPEELKIKAEKGDKFATEFLSVFVPYDNIEEAVKIFPDYINLLKTKYGSIEDIHFYYCPKLSKDNLCTDYENRPSICRDFPNNALAILPENCGFKPWKDEIEVIALTLHALSDIIGFYVEKLEILLKEK